MNTKPRCCAPSDTLASAAQIMREHDCGFLPVVREGNRLVGVITDRDICLAAESRARQSCRQSAQIADVLAVMQNYRVRRVPVVDAAGQLVGVVSLSDLARRADRGEDDNGVSREAITHTLAAICEPRSAAHYA
jgi:CBS domain-containing protein